jgi:hypothetical protein
MFTRNRLIAAAAVVGALATAGPVAGASADQTGAVVTPSPTSSIPCYPLPAWCGSDGQPTPWAPAWVRSALGLAPSPMWSPIQLVPLA